MCGNATGSEAWLRFLMRSAVAARSFFPPLERVQIERMACTDPAAYGLHLTHWDCRSLQQCAIEQGAVETIHYTTVAQMLAEASLVEPEKRQKRRVGGGYSSNRMG